jgi:8-oxo-dGTP pyrophosphatase MutT (NUDIX family)
MTHPEELHLSLNDTEWPLTYTSHDRTIVRAIVVDDDHNFYFVRAERDDDFGRATIIETSGGGVEAGEDLDSAIKRELSEELGADVVILCKLGVVSDYYNLIHRHNINHYYLCRVKSFGAKHLMPDEIEQFHLSTLKLSYDEAVAEYELRTETPLGRLLAQRELPILRHAKQILDQISSER